MTTLYAVYGVGGCGRGVMPLVRSALARQDVAMESIVFVDDSCAHAAVNGHQVLTYDRFLDEPVESHAVVVAVSSGVIRANIVDKCAAAGVGFFEVRAQSVVEMDDVAVGDGAILSPYVTLTSNIRIGRHFHANLYSYVEHDCVIGDFVTFAPGVQCNGNVVIEDYAYVGAGAVIRQGRPGEPLVIGRGAVIGMGAIVTMSVPPGATVVGNPARPLVNR